MAAFTHIDRASADRLVESFDLGKVLKVQPIPEGIVNSNHRLETDREVYFVRIYEEKGLLGARKAAELASELNTKGVRTPAPLADREGRHIAVVGEKPAAIFPWIDGAIVCQKMVTRAHATRVGEALAKLHVAGEGVAIGEGRFRIEDIRRRLFQIKQPKWRDATRELMAAMDRWAPKRTPDLPEGLVHGDLFRDNVLWKENEIVALLDFESASQGSFVWDLAVTILAWCYGDDFDRELVGSMIAGYDSVRALSNIEREALLTEACIAAIRFATTRITDYAMKPSEGRVMKDYKRFLSRLESLERDGLG